MSGYNRQEKTFTLTADRMEHYHRNHLHTTFSRKHCPICNYQYGEEYMQIVADFLTANGFDVLEIGDAHLTIHAPSRPRKKFGMWITKESDALYQLIAGRIEPQPGSIPADSDSLMPYRNDLPQPASETLESGTPSEQLSHWLNELKTQKQRELQQAQTRLESLGQAGMTVISRKAEIRIIEQIQTKIRELSESA